MSHENYGQWFFEAERPLFAPQSVRLEQVKFDPGESALKHGKEVQNPTN